MGAEFSSQMNRGIDDLYTGTPRDTLRRYELVVQDIQRLQDALPNIKHYGLRYKKWYKYVLLRNMLRREIEKLYANKQLEDMGIDFDMGMLAGVNFGEFNNSFPRHVIEYDGKIQWLPGEFSEMITVYVREYNRYIPENDIAGVDGEVTLSYRISRFAPAKELWKMVHDSKNKRFLPTAYIQNTVRNTFKIQAPITTIFQTSEDPLIFHGVNDDATLRVYW